MRLITRRKRNVFVLKIQGFFVRAKIGAVRAAKSTTGVVAKIVLWL